MQDQVKKCDNLSMWWGVIFSWGFDWQSMMCRGDKERKKMPITCLWKVIEGRFATHSAGKHRGICETMVVLCCRAGWATVFKIPAREEIPLMNDVLRLRNISYMNWKLRYMQPRFFSLVIFMDLKKSRILPKIKIFEMPHLKMFMII